MKKTLSLILAALTLLSLTACQPDEEPPEVSDQIITVADLPKEAYDYIKYITKKSCVIFIFSIDK